MELHHLPFVAELPPKPSIWAAHISCLCRRNRGPHLSSPIETICQPSNSLAEDYPCDAVPFWRFYWLHSWVCHLRSACQVRYHPNHLYCLSPTPHRLNLQDRSDYPKYHPKSLHMLFLAVWLSIPSLHHISYLPAPAQLLFLHLHLAFFPQWIIYPYTSQSISHSLWGLNGDFVILSPPEAAS